MITSHICKSHRRRPVISVATFLLINVLSLFFVQVTDLAFLDSSKKLVSSSKDKFLRVWNLETQHCMQIVGGHHSEIWSMDIDPDERFLVTGSADQELRFFTTEHDLVAGKSVDESNTNGTEKDKDQPTQSKWEVLKQFGEILRQSKDRVATVRFNKSGNLVACQVAGKTVELFQVLDETEAKRKAKRRLNRKKGKKAGKGEQDVIENGNIDRVTGEEGSGNMITAPDVFKPLHTIRASKKICSISFCPSVPKNSLSTLALSLNNNLLEFYSVESSAVTKLHSIELQGHRSDVRSVTLSSDNSLLMSTSHNAVKIWNPSTGSCLRTIDSGYGLCGLIIPQNKYALVGNKSGAIEIMDIASGSCIEVVEAHGGDIRSIVAVPNENGFVTASADHDIKFWEYQIEKKSNQVCSHTFSLFDFNKVFTITIFILFFVQLRWVLSLKYVASIGNSEMSPSRKVVFNEESNFILAFFEFWIDLISFQLGEIFLHESSSDYGFLGQMVLNGEYMK